MDTEMEMTEIEKFEFYLDSIQVELKGTWCLHQASQCAEWAAEVAHRLRLPQWERELWALAQELWAASR